MVAPTRPATSPGKAVSGFENPYKGAITIQDPTDPTSQIVLEPTTSAYIEIMSSDGGDVFFNPYGGVSFDMLNANNSGMSGIWNAPGAYGMNFKITDDTGAAIFELHQVHSGPGQLGLFGHGTSPQQTVTGSRGGNAALASLLTALAQYGLIIDSTSP